MEKTLIIKNSLNSTQSKIELNNNPLSFYMCGPTVYAPPHLGHARTYITFDIITRILKSYFNANLTCGMNITDVDDKIIKATREIFYYKAYKSKKLSFINKTMDNPILFNENIETIFSDLSRFYSTVLKSISSAIEKTNEQLELVSEASSTTPGKGSYKEITELKESLLTLNFRFKNTQSDYDRFESSGYRSYFSDVLQKASDLHRIEGDLLEKLESMFKENSTIIGEFFLSVKSAAPGESPEDYSHEDSEVVDAAPGKEAFVKFAYENEKIFFEQMDALNVKRPDVLSRCTEYIGPMADFVQDLLEGGLAYRTEDGSINFSIHKYISLTRQTPSGATEKRFAYGNFFKYVPSEGPENDFVLWKAVCPDEEPGWDTKFGRGRPGWHLECSAMSQQMFGEHLDFHGGGIDLKFPHHENEIVQCNARNFILREASSSLGSKVDDSKANALKQKADKKAPSKKNSRASGQVSSDLVLEKNNEGEGSGAQKDWCSVFLHSGHLNIQGQKMSKSLKNFVSVADLFTKLSSPASLFVRLPLHLFNDRSAPEFKRTFDKELTREASNLIRVLFINSGNPWGVMNFEEKQFEEVQNLYATLKEFLLKIKSVERKKAILKSLSVNSFEIYAKGKLVQTFNFVFKDPFGQSVEEPFEEMETKLLAEKEKAAQDVHRAFLNNFGFHKAFKAILALIKQANTYIKRRCLIKMNAHLLSSISSLVRRIVSILGIEIKTDALVGDLKHEAGSVHTSIKGEEASINGSSALLETLGFSQEEQLFNLYSLVREGLRAHFKLLQRKEKYSRCCSLKISVLALVKLLEEMVHSYRGRSMLVREKFESLIEKLYSSGYVRRKDIYEQLDGLNVENNVEGNSEDLNEALELLSILDTFRSATWVEYGLKSEDLKEFNLWV